MTEAQLNFARADAKLFLKAFGKISMAVEADFESDFGWSGSFLLQEFVTTYF